MKLLHVAAIASFVTLVFACSGASNENTDRPGDDTDASSSAPPGTNPGDGGTNPDAPVVETRGDWQEPSCSSDGWCWEHPAPMGEPLWRLHAVNARDVWAIGRGGVLAHFDGKTWSQVASPVTADLHGIGGSDASHIWAVGNGGTLLRFDGTSWKVEVSSTTNQLRSVWATSANDAWAVGDDVILHWNGTSWAPASSTITGVFRLWSVWASGSDDVWALDSPSMVWHLSGGVWKEEKPPLIGSGAVWGSGPKDVWIGGSGSSVAHFDGATWKTFDLPGVSSADAMYSIHGTGPNDVWFATLYNLHHWDGTKITTAKRDFEMPVSGSFQSVRAIGKDDAWALGSNGFLARYDGTKWASSVVTDAQVRGLTTSGTNAFAVGNAYAQKSELLRFDGKRWTQKIINIDRLYDAFALAPDDVWMVGLLGPINAGGIALHWDGKDVQYHQNVITSADVNGVWAAAKNDVYVVGRSGKMGHYDGTSWAPVATGTTEALGHIWGADASNVWATGPDGTIVSKSGASFSPVTPAPTASHLTGIHGRSASDVWIVGTDGAILHLEGGTWTPKTSNTTADLSAVWARAANDVWAVGYGGTILHYDGASWKAQKSGTTRDLFSVSGDSTGAVRVGGDKGAILRHK